ncbi:hypothetical protein P879_04829 [Paragonimus westermani]|uniref:Carboxypeptidase n=1 Tax=Paragonimus westermani TaxID=34504 RepID=A0A8T0DH34_9TREM|nr:hypothetical protein P879_04829 [Paragonimus westermani]
METRVLSLVLLIVLSDSASVRKRQFCYTKHSHRGTEYDAIHKTSGERRVHAEKDRILSLPNLTFEPQFQQYAGYLDGASPNIKLFYWLVEAVENPSEAPLLLWLNGGPGCSSLSGLLSGNGPFSVNPDLELESNPYSWNKALNVLYLESPAGVGFSCTNDGNITASDDLTAWNNFQALVNFLKKYPAYKYRALYIAGESYAGVYVPTLALHLIQKENAFRLKGILVGNPMTNYVLNENSGFYNLYYHGFLSDEHWDNLVELCCPDQYGQHCMFTLNNSVGCQLAFQSVHDDLAVNINPYNPYQNCAGGIAKLKPTNNTTPLISKPWKPLIGGQSAYTQLFTEKLSLPVAIETEESDYLKCPAQKSVCGRDTFVHEYLNLPEVQDALHVDKHFTNCWTSCNLKVFRDYVRQYGNMDRVYTQILSSQVPVMFYSGDFDLVINSMGTRWFVKSLQLEVSKQVRATG